MYLKHRWDMEVHKMQNKNDFWKILNIIFNVQM